MKKLLLITSLLSASCAFGMQEIGMQTPDANSSAECKARLTYAEYETKLAMQKNLIDQKIKEMKKAYDLHSEARHRLFNTIRGTQRIMVGCGTGLGFAASVVGSVLFPNISKRTIVGTVAVGALAGYVLADTVIEHSPVTYIELINYQKAASKHCSACDEYMKAKDELKRIADELFATCS